MISILLIALFATISVVSLSSLMDSAVRGHNCWTAIRRETALQSGQVARPSVNFSHASAVVVPLRPVASPRPAPRLPQAVAA